ncbi:MAG TPA: type II toxin-antitoxin system RelE/ParE family toxin [Thermoplasmata archaeon]|nr:type II toxin-antitoxin system RelE/ParE family toxin [Thermoplasmata archaeon]
MELKRSCERELSRLPDHVKRRFALSIAELEKGPLVGRPHFDVAKLEGEGNTWRLRLGQYRALFEVDGTVITVTTIAHRSKVY